MSTSNKKKRKYVQESTGNDDHDDDPFLSSSILINNNNNHNNNSHHETKRSSCCKRELDELYHKTTTVVTQIIKQQQVQQQPHIPTSDNNNNNNNNNSNNHISIGSNDIVTIQEKEYQEQPSISIDTIEVFQKNNSNMNDVNNNHNNNTTTTTRTTTSSSDFLLTTSIQPQLLENTTTMPTTKKRKVCTINTGGAKDHIATITDATTVHHATTTTTTIPTTSTKNSIVDSILENCTQLRLEAIFHPKFENEKKTTTTTTTSTRKYNNNNKKQQQQQQLPTRNTPTDASTTTTTTTDPREVTNTIPQTTTPSASIMNNNTIIGMDSSSSSLSIRQQMLDRVSNRFDGVTGDDDVDVDVSTSSSSLGYLEVTVKHSGSLVLWSGQYQRYYSKNSTYNQFTFVGEMLLRQHFIRVYWNEFILKQQQQQQNTTNRPLDPELMYQTCGDYISIHRLTLSFEVVTCRLLGDHGSHPIRDYIILTAVADKNTGTFYTTKQLLEFAIKFRLPYNDIWIYKETKNVQEELFQFYDEYREIGLAQNIVPKLNTSCHVHIPSLYPHEHFQGNILEGIVIRYVPYPPVTTTTTTTGTTTTTFPNINNDPNMIIQQQHQQQQQQQQLEQREIFWNEFHELSKQAKQLCSIIPPSVPECYELIRQYYDENNKNRINNNNNNNNKDDDTTIMYPFSSMVTTNVRNLQINPRNNTSPTTEKMDIVQNLLKQTIELRKSTYQHQEHQQEQLKNPMDQYERSVTRLSDIAPIHDKEWVMKLAKKLANLPEHTTTTTTSSVVIDKETQKIATLLLQTDTHDVKYTMYKETTIRPTMTTSSTSPDESSSSFRIEEDNNNNNITSPPACSTTTTTTTTTSTRYICIVHVLHDSTFPKFQKKMKPGDLPLYRGFSFEMICRENQLHADSDMDVCMSNDDVQNRKSLNHNDKNNIETTSSQLLLPTMEVPLMLKMKFLPYMIRTFICRNGLKILQKDKNTSDIGPFISFANNLLCNWNISQQKKDEYIPFFTGWAEYAMKVMQEQKQQQRPPPPHNIVTKPTSVERTLPFLSDSQYLDHYEYFLELYESNKTVHNTHNKESTFRGLVVVVSAEKGLADTVADFLCKQLHGSKRFLDYSKLNDKIMSLVQRKGYGQICSTSFLNGPKGVLKKKEYLDYITILFFGCNDDDLNRRLTQTPQNELKKERGMLQTWKKLDHKIINLPVQSLFDRIDSDIVLRAEPSKEFQKMLKDIVATSDALNKTLASSNTEVNNGPGLLLFFPMIPGSGKSALCSTCKQNDELQTIFNSFEKKRNLIIRVGDEFSKNTFWPKVESDRILDPSSVFVIDKNCTPGGALMNIGQICLESQAFAVPVIPDAMALTTTILEGARHPDGTISNQSTKHVYPFSLEFVALCLARVMDRPPGSHNGKLDRENCKEACMLVIKFFSFYRNISAEDYVQRISAEIAKAGGLLCPSPIVVPVFRSDIIPIVPKDLGDLITEAAVHQFGTTTYSNIAKGFKEKKAEYEKDLENRLRRSINQHRDFILSWSVDLETSRKSLVNQLIQNVCFVNSVDKYETSTTPFAKYASIDVPLNGIQAILNQLKENCKLKTFFDMVKIQDSNNIDETPINESMSPGSTSTTTNPSKFVVDTHVTLAHCSQMTQDKLRQTFEPYCGCHVPISVIGIFWNECIAAFEVTLPNKIEAEYNKQIDVPHCQNTFVHITLWHVQGTSAKESNNLQTLYHSGQANYVQFDEPIKVDGVICIHEEPLPEVYEKWDGA